MPIDPPASLVRLGARVSSRIDTLLAAEQERWAAVDGILVDPIASLRELVKGGKRLRPAFCHWGFVGAGGDPDDERVVDAGAAIELLHVMALIHDDVMDGSVRRHGQTCLHVDYADRHVAHGWYGEARRFGNGAAILIGDLAFVYADRLLPAAPPEVAEVFTDLRLEVNVGQFLDLACTASGDAGTAQAHTIAVYKSGKYTIERPLQLGAALAGRLDDLGKWCTAYGLPLGEAFQLRDDLLGAFGDGEKLGKGVGEDLRDGKPTSLYALTRARATGADADALASRMGRADIDESDVAVIQRIMTRTGARSEVEGTIDALVAEALQALADAPLTDLARNELRALAAFVVDRDF